jgi:hypothetical protein
VGVQLPAAAYFLHQHDIPTPVKCAEEKLVCPSAVCDVVVAAVPTLKANSVDRVKESDRP